MVRLLGLWLVVVAVGSSCSGKDGKDGTSCSVTKEADGSATIRCSDGTSVTVPAGKDGATASCTVTDQGNGTRLISCTDGTSATVANGSNGTSCTVSTDDAGVKTISCADGTTATVTNGASGGSCTISADDAGVKTIRCADGTVVTVRDGLNAASARVTDHHGEAFVQSSGEFANGKYLVDTVITAASADDAGVLTVDFRVARPNGAPVLDLPAVNANVARLEATPWASPRTGEATAWVPYLYRVETVVGSGFPNPAGTTALQATRESNGTLVNHHDGTYTYTFAARLTAATANGTPVPYLRDRKHRVSLMLGGHTGATGTATFDFVPDGSSDAHTRDIVRTTACQQCHGAGFQAHGGDRMSVENCVTCHVPGTRDAQGGQSLDFRVMIHKIHRGGDLPSVAGPDRNPWLTADNGEYAIWGYGDVKHDWRTVGFPANVNNCVKCHDGSGANADVWKTEPTGPACGACHDDVDFTTGTNHAAGPSIDRNCAVCHPATGGLVPLATVHDSATTDTSQPLFDARNQPEFTFDVTMTPPANGTDYRGNEAPVVRVVIRRNGTPIPDHRILAGAAQGCRHTISATLCDPDSDGRYANTSLFVAGPRAHARPVLTTAARAQITSTTSGPFDLSTAGATLTLKVDQGVSVPRADAPTPLAGLITVPVSAGTFGALSSASVDEVVTWLNGNAAFAARALASRDPSTSRVTIRSRGLGPFPGIQLVASSVATSVFGGDLNLKGPSGTTAANQLTSTTDPKVTRFVDHIEYQLDPVTDLAAGTYVVNLEVSQLGRVSATDYVTPSVHKHRFNVKQATEEPLVASGCDSCHQATSGPDFTGFVLDRSRHNKIFDATAIDQCIACHDYLPQSPTDATGLGQWTGAKPISRRVHAVHFGSSLQYPLRTVDYANGDPTIGRNWNITFPQSVLNCEACHTASTSGTWKKANRLACSGCHDGDAAMAHLAVNTFDPTPSDPWSGDESESCQTCH